jgi:hypothetical protein
MPNKKYIDNKDILICYVYNIISLYLFSRSLHEYGAKSCTQKNLQIQHGTVTGVCVAGQNIYGDIEESGIYSCSQSADKVRFMLIYHFIFQKYDTV